MAKHSGAETVRVRVGIRERVYLAGGALELRSWEHGTLVRAQLLARVSGEQSESVVVG